MITFGSVCSGIEAASVAWHPLGWRAAWLAEIEPFPSAVLRHHYPEVPNLGDMTTLPDRIRSGEIEAPDLFCGGTPCQAFSVAGLRRSLDDARGNLSLTFCEIADAIDSVRLAGGKPASIVFWENVPGVLSTADNAFGCFLGALAGCDTAIKPLAATGWTDAGVVAGPSRAVAWRVLDAQFFGLAQRRRRVFVVASARDGFDPGAVLLEWEGVRRDTPPSRETGESAAPCVTAGAANGGAAHGARSGSAKDNLIVPVGIDFQNAALSGDMAGTLDAEGQRRGNRGHGVLAFGGGQNCAQTDVSTSLSAHPGGSRLDFQTETFVASVGYPDPAYAITAGAQGKGGVFGSGRDSQDTFVTHSLRGEGLDASKDGTWRGTPLVPVHAFDARQSGVLQYGDKTGPLDTDGHSVGVMQPVAFHPTQDPISSSDGSMHAMGCGSKGGAATVAVAFPIDTMNHIGRSDNHSFGDFEPGAPSYTLTKGHSHAVAAVFVQDDTTPKVGDDLANCLRRDAGGEGACVLPPVSMQVRRLTPTECERLQGFPDGYTQIPWRGKPASECPDGPRYKALGNSWAVPVVRWIGRRIHDAVQEANPD